MKSKKNKGQLYCCGCQADVVARFTNGKEVYPHRSDLHDLPFWICDACGNFVGCHHKNKNNPTQPLGCIATPEIKKARQHIHKLIDPVWQTGKISRASLYKKISDAVGWKYHTSKIRSVEEGRSVYRAAKKIIEPLFKEV